MSWNRALEGNDYAIKERFRVGRVGDQELQVAGGGVHFNEAYQKRRDFQFFIFGLPETRTPWA